MMRRIQRDIGSLTRCIICRRRAERTSTGVASRFNAFPKYPATPLAFGRESRCPDARLPCATRGRRSDYTIDRWHDAHVPTARQWKWWEEPHANMSPRDRDNEAIARHIVNRGAMILV